MTKGVASNLNISMGNKPNSFNNGLSGYTGKPYLGKPRAPKLALGIDGSLNPKLTCWYCKDTGHLKENCVTLSQRLTPEHREAEKKLVSNDNAANRLPK